MKNNLKQQVTDWITDCNYDAIVQAAEAGSEKCLRYAQMNIWGDSHQTQRWYAITAMEHLASAYSTREEEVYRNVIRRAVWAMSDESGNVPWAAPEMMAVIIQSAPGKFKEFVKIMLSNGLDNPMCHAGVLWAAGYLGEAYSEDMGKYRDRMLTFLHSPDSELRGLAVWAFRRLQYAPAMEQMAALTEDEGITWIYEDGELKQISVRELLTR